MADENREKVRSNVFLAGTLHCDDKQDDVRIRNLSGAGALIEGQTLPQTGTRVRLTRGDLSAVGTVAWAMSCHAGIRFDSAVKADQWTARHGHAGQQRVDGVLAAIKGARPVPAELRKDEQVTLPILSAALDQLCERLACSPVFSLDHADDLLKLDAIAQSLRFHATRRLF